MNSRAWDLNLLSREVEGHFQYWCQRVLGSPNNRAHTGLVRGPGGCTTKSCLAIASTVKYRYWDSSLKHLVRNTAIPLHK